MDRKIQWVDGYYDGIEMEIEPIYDKASKNENIARLLSELEIGALAEARNLRMLSGNPRPFNDRDESAILPR